MKNPNEIAERILGTQNMKLDDIVRDYDGVVTIIGLGYTEYKGSRIPVFSFLEGEGATFWGGCQKLRELATALEEAYGDLREVNEALITNPVAIRIGKLVKTKAGMPFRPITMIKRDVIASQVNEPDDGQVNSSDAEPEYDPF